MRKTPEVQSRPDLDQYLSRSGKLLTDKMPPEAKNALWEYHHHRGNRGKDDPDAIAEAAKFEKLTGISASDLYEYRKMIKGRPID